MMLEEELKGAKKCFWMNLEAGEVHRKAILTALEAHARRKLEHLELVATTQGQNLSSDIWKSQSRASPMHAATQVSQGFGFAEELRLTDPCIPLRHNAI